MTVKSKRATIYLEPELHRMLKVKAAESSKSVSDLVNDAVRETLVGYDASDPESWLEEGFKLMDRADANSEGRKWKRADLYDV